MVASLACGLCICEQSFVDHGVEVVDYTGSTDTASKALIHIDPDGSSVHSLRLYAPEVA